MPRVAGPVTPVGPFHVVLSKDVFGGAHQISTLSELDTELPMALRDESTIIVIQDTGELWALDEDLATLIVPRVNCASFADYQAGDAGQSTDIANLQFVADAFRAFYYYFNDFFAGGYSSVWRDSCVVITTTPITLSGLQTYDGAFINVDGMRVCVNGQPNPVDNGMYRAHTGAWTRAEDFDNASPFYDAAYGAAFMVVGGSKTGLYWINGAINWGVSAIHFKSAGSAVTSQSQWKDPVKYVATGTLSLTGPATPDGTAVVTGDRVLYAATGADRGIYIANTAGAWTRAPDANTSALVLSGMTVLVTDGTTPNKNTIWTLTTTGAIVLGTTALTFAQRNVSESSVRAAAALFTAALDVHAQQVKNAADATATTDLITLGQVYRGINSQSASYTVVASDYAKLLVMGNAADGTVTIPNITSVPRTPGDWFEVVRSGAGRLRIARGTNVVFTGPASYWLRLGGRCRCTYLSTTSGVDTWLIDGPGLLPFGGLWYPAVSSAGYLSTVGGTSGFTGATTGWVISLFLYQHYRASNTQDNQILANKGNATSQGWQLQNVSGWEARVANTAGAIVNSPGTSNVTANPGKIHALHFVFDNAASLVRTVLNGAQVGSGTSCVGYTPSTTLAMIVCPQATSWNFALYAMTCANGAYSLSDIQAMEAAFKSDRYAPAYGAGYAGQKVWNFGIAEDAPFAPEDVGAATADIVAISAAAGNGAPIIYSPNGFAFAF